MSCEKFDDALIRRLVDSSVDTLELETHLKSCDRCAARAADMARMSRDFSALAETLNSIDPPFEFSPGDSTTHAAQPHRRLFRLIPPAIAAAVIAAGLLISQHFPSDRPGDEPRSAALESAAAQRLLVRHETARLWSPRLSPVRFAPHSASPRGDGINSFRFLRRPLERRPKAPSLIFLNRRNRDVDDHADPPRDTDHDDDGVHGHGNPTGRLRAVPV